MNVSLRELRTRITQLDNMLIQIEKKDEKEKDFLLAKIKSATPDLIIMDCNLANSADESAQIKVCKRGFKFIRGNDTNN